MNTRTTHPRARDFQAPEDIENARDFAEFLDTGLLWLINTTVFHPRGYSLAIKVDKDSGTAVGWNLLGDGTEPWTFGDDCDDKFQAAQSLLG